MAIARVNRPAVVVYGGTIRAGCRPDKDEKLDIISAFQAYGEYITGKVDDATRLDIVRNACPGPGACGGMYTANTMASAIEALGLSVPYSSSIWNVERATQAHQRQPMHVCWSTHSIALASRSLGTSGGQ